MKRSRQRFNPRIYHPFNGEKMLNSTNEQNKDKMTHLFEQIKSIERANRKEKEKAAKANATEIKNESYDIDASLKKSMEKKRINFDVVHTNDSEGQEMNTIPQVNILPEEEEPLYHIVNNQRLSSMLDYKDTIQKLIDMIEHAEDQYNYCRNKITESDREVQDFLHEVRAPKKNAYEGFKLYQIGHKIEIKRQAYKEGASLLKPYVSYVKKLKDDLDNLKYIVEYTNNFFEGIQNAIYMPRSDLKLPVGDKFRSLSKEQQEIIRQNHQKNKKA